MNINYELNEEQELIYKAKEELKRISENSERVNKELLEEAAKLLDLGVI